VTPTALEAQLRTGALIPYIGPGLLGPDAGCPTTPVQLAAALNAKVAVPGRIRTNLWSTAQWIESHRHKRTLDALMNQIFAPQVQPSPVHRWLAGLGCPMIVDSWYDGALTAAFQQRSDWIDNSWGLVQGVHRAGATRDIWTRAYDPSGVETLPDVAGGWTTLLYKPHGGAWPAGQMLASDADYVEVLTEIDIQSPIPDDVKVRRTGRGFVFLGCRFDDQLLRTFARQILKRSDGPYIAIMPDEITRNEAKFLAEIGAEVVRQDVLTSLFAPV
jgi:hypothetical protein